MSADDMELNRRGFNMGVDEAEVTHQAWQEREGSTTCR
jgi:hypothetical protein